MPPLRELLDEDTSREGWKIGWGSQLTWVRNLEAEVNERCSASGSTAVVVVQRMAVERVELGKSVSGYLRHVYHKRVEARKAAKKRD
jgi:hypothetical protein